MRRIMILVATLCMTLFATGFESSAQSKYGVIGGINFSTANVRNMNRGSMTQWHAGLTYRLDLPLGFSFQPSLIYNVKGAKVGKGDTPAKFDISMGYIELPLSFQWGPDLLLFRPFIDVTPYIGYAVNNKLVGLQPNPVKNQWANLQRFEYGLGLGIGLDIWRFQVLARYNWNFGPLSRAKDTFNAGDPSTVIRQLFSDKNFGGVTLSVAFLFGGGK